MSKEVFQRLPTLVNPDINGRYESLSVLNSIFIARPPDRNIPPIEPQKPQYEPIEMASNLIIRLRPEDVGFDVQKEMNRLLSDTNRSLEEGKSLDEAVGLSAKTLEVNLRTHDGEIIKQRPVLPHLNRFSMKNGALRMVGENGEPVIDAITTEERRGSVKEASHVIENFLLGAGNNSYAVLMNPAGLNGYIGKNKEKLSHLNAEVMIFSKDESGDLKGLTIVVDLLESQAREIMIRLGISRDLLGGDSEMERLANIVRNPALLSFPGSDITPFEYVLDKMLSIRGDQAFRLLQRDRSEVIRSIEEVRTDIRELDQLFRLSLEEERRIIQPRQLVLAEKENLKEAVVQQAIINKIEETILYLTREHLKETGFIDNTVIYQAVRGIEPRAIRNPFLEKDNFDKEIAYLKTRSGCPPGRTLSGRVLGGVSLGSAISISDAISIESGGFMKEDQHGSLEFECPHADCKQINRRPNGKLIENCQYCGKSVRC